MSLPTSVWQWYDNLGKLTCGSDPWMWARSSILYLSHHNAFYNISWNIYKKIGADIRIQRKLSMQIPSLLCRSNFMFYFLLTIPLIGMYRTFQFFVLALKIDLFFEFMVSVFYCIQFGLRSGITGETGIQLVVTILLVPMLYFSRMAVSVFNVIDPTFFLCTN